MHDLEKREIARRLRQQAHELFMMAKQLDPPDERADKPVKKPKGYDVNTIDWVEEMLEAEGADQA